MEILGGSRDVSCNVDIRIRYNSSVNREWAPPLLLLLLRSVASLARQDGMLAALAVGLAGTFLLVLTGGAVTPFSCASPI